MFEGVRLITCDESRELFNVQKKIMKKYSETNDDEYILQLALLQTLAPIEDYGAASTILNCCNDGYNFKMLIIGAYLLTEDYDCTDNYFLTRLMEKFCYFDRKQKSVSKYLDALEGYNKGIYSQQEIIKRLNESIELYSDYASHYYLRYLITRNNDDLVAAKNNICVLLSDKDISLLSKSDLINPDSFIAEFIYKTEMGASTFAGVFGMVKC